MHSIPYTFLAAAAAVVLFSCTREYVPDRPSDREIAERQIRFRVNERTKSPEVVASLDSFFVTATYGKAASQPPLWQNGVFRTDGHGTYGSVGVVHLWPTTDQDYHFSASNVRMEHTQNGERVTVEAVETDVVCAYLEHPLFQMPNTFEFRHILARIGKVSASGLENATDVSISIYCYLKGTYYLKSARWEYPGYMEYVNLVLDEDNRLWLVPGQYLLTLSFRDRTTGEKYRKSLPETFEAGISNDIDVTVKY